MTTLDILNKMPIDNFQIEKFLGKNIKIVKDNDIKDYKDINQLFPVDDVCVVLLEKMNNIGHWVCLLRYEDYYEYFDSFGDKPPKFIRDLLKKTNKKIIYNCVKLQDIKLATCGKFCVIRIFYKDVEYITFIKLLRYLKKITKLSFDDICSGILNNI